MVSEAGGYSRSFCQYPDYQEKWEKIQGEKKEKAKPKGNPYAILAS